MSERALPNTSRHTLSTTRARLVFLEISRSLAPAAGTSPSLSRANLPPRHRCFTGFVNSANVFAGRRNVKSNKTSVYLHLFASSFNYDMLRKYNDHVEHNVDRQSSSSSSSVVLSSYKRRLENGGEWRKTITFREKNNRLLLHRKTL